jgi:glycosyltransferase involved in cell wall biosynthesis
MNFNTKLSKSPVSGVSGGPSSLPLLLCFSHLRWDFVWQRPQHLLSRASSAYDVVFVEEPVVRRGASPVLESGVRACGVEVATPILPEGLDAQETIAAQKTLLDQLIFRRRREPQVLWYYTPMALEFSRHLEAPTIVYDNMDELSLFRGASQRIIDLEAELFARADVVFTGGMSLYEAKRHRHHNIHGLPSSIDRAHFLTARGARETQPADQSALPGPRLGFFGVIDERMDLDLLAGVAALRPNWTFVMIGPVVKIDPASLPRRDNIHWLGQRSYDELPRYLAGWDVGFMNFALNEATRFISPTKTPEFLAAGVPVVSTAIRDVVDPYGARGLVEIASTPAEVVDAAERVLARPKAPWLRKVDRHLATGSWDKTWRKMDRLIAACAAPGETALGVGYGVAAAE